MLKWLLASVVVVLVWTAWFLFGIPPLWATILITVLVGLAVGSVYLLRKLRARRAARELERALAAQAADQARSARPDLQAEIHEMQSEFQRAIQALKTSKLGRGGGNALYELPWYVIIGPPGSGKSTALRNSGLQFPYMSRSGGSVRGIGGTRNCDWWLTNEAVLLDTAGRWSIEDEDRVEWHGFLDLLRRFRPRKPLNGILVAVSVSELASAHEEEVVGVGRRIRERVDEVMGRLQMSLPVYVLFTKCDLIPGFVEIFGDLDRTQRGQIWGFTAPLAQPIGEPGHYFGERFDELGQIIEQRAIRRMGEERKIDSRERIHEFPQQFQIVKKNLADFIGQLFSENVYQETPQFRGAYFTSGTQEGRPIDRVMSRMAEAFGLQGRVPPAEPVVDPKSYFLRDVFSHVVFPDRVIAARSAGEVRRQRMRQAIAAAAIFFIAILMSTLPAYTWYNSRDFLDETETVAVAAAEGEPDETLADIDALRDRTRLLKDYEDDGAPYSMRLGMYQGDDVYPALRDFYTTVLRQRLVQPIVDRDTDEMMEFGRRFREFENARPTPEEHGKFYNVLKSYLLLSKPSEPSQPALEDEEELRDWLTRQLVRRWAEAAGTDLESDEAENMADHTAFYTDLVAADDELLFQRDGENVQRVRNALNRLSGESLAMNQIIAQFDGRGYDITPERMLGTTSAIRAREGARVRGAFTRRAWDESVLETLSAPGQEFLGEPWVLGRQIDNERPSEAQLDALRCEYFRRYVGEWREYIDALRASPSGNHTEALRNLQALTSGDPTPHGALFGRLDDARSVFSVGYNTRLPVPEPPENEAEDSTVVSTLIKQGERRLQGSTGQLLRSAIQDAQSQWRAPPGADGIQCGDPRYVEEEFKGFTRFGVPLATEGNAPAPTTSLDHYLEQLRFVRDALQTYVDDPTSSDQLMGKLQMARTVVRGLIEEQQLGWRPNFEALLWPPIESAAVNSSMALGMSAGRSWCSEVYTPWNESLHNRYPFNANGHDAPIDDFTVFFQPEEGTLWAFYKEMLESDIELAGNDFQPSRRLGRDTNTVYQSGLTGYLTRARDVTRSFFPPGSAEPKADFDVRIRPSPRVATVQLTVDEQVVSYENAPERWTRITWPNAEASARGASIEVRGENGMHEVVRQEGEWGFFRLLEAGTVTSRGTGVFTMGWRLHTHDVDIVIEVRPAREQSPFFGVPNRSRSPGLLQPVRADVTPPRDIIAGGGQPCRR